MRIAPDPARRPKPHNEWPTKDRRAWSKARKKGSLLGLTGKAAHWRRDSCEKVTISYGRWLTYLDLNGLLTPALPPVARINLGAVVPYVRELQGQVSSATVFGRMRDLFDAARVMDPKANLAWLKRIVDRLRRRIVTTRQKATQSSSELFEIGIELMRSARSARRDAVRTATRFRDGLIISLLAARPLTLRSMSRLELGRQLIRTKAGWQICLVGDDTKTGAYWQVMIPDVLVGFMDEYVSTFRPVFLKEEVCAHVWLSLFGQALTHYSIAFTLRTRTKVACGTAHSALNFRDAALFGFVDHDPAHVRAAAALLGHCQLTSTQEHYEQAQGLLASRVHQGIVARLRRNLHSPGTAARVGKKVTPPKSQTSSRKKKLPR